MKATKTIDVKLNGLYDARFTLEFAEDEQGGEFGVLTVPYVQWFSLEENAVYKNVYKISGEVLECIEKQYFDNNVVSIPVKCNSSPILIEDVILEMMPKKIYKQMLKGTYKIDDDADKSIYGNLPVKINTKSAKKDKQEEVEIVSSPSFDGMKEALKHILGDENMQIIEQMIDGTYEPDANEASSKQGNRHKKKK